MKKEIKKTVVAIYIRVSTDRQHTDGYSFEEQEKILREHCEHHSEDVYEVYGDGGISGKDIVHRIEFRRMLQDAKEKKFDKVIVWKLSRFARSLKDLMITVADLEKLGIGLESYTERFDSTTASGKLMRNMLGAIAEFDRDVISENVKMAYAARARKGNRTCSSILGYDCDGKNSLKINETEAEVVRFIFAEYLHCKCLTETAKSANIRGYRGKNGHPFSPAAIERILRSFTYCGYYRFRQEFVIASEPFPVIITAKQYNDVQRQRLRMHKLHGRSFVKPLVLLPET